MRICLIVGLSLAFSFTPVKAQIRFKDPKSALHYRIDLENQDLWRENKVGEWSKVFDLTFEKVDVQELPVNSLIFSFSQKGNMLLLVEGTGQIYELDTLKKKLTRIDKTFYRGNNFGAIRFVHKDTVFCVGGQGFWYTNNIETYFSKKSKEWELYHSPSPAGPNRMRTDYGGFDKKRDLLSVVEFPPLYQTSTSDHPYRYFEKPFNQESWNYKGDLNVSLLRKLGVQKFESTFIQGVYLFRNGPFLVLGDPVTNELYQINQVIPILNEVFELSENNGYIYSYHVNKNSNGQESSIKVDSISIEQMKALGKSKGKFYLTSNPLLEYSLLGLGVLLVLLVGLILILRRKKNQAISVVPPSESLFEFSILDGLPEGAYGFLRASLDFPPGHQFSSQAFTELMGYSTYAYETQRQVRSKLIKSINSYFSVHYKMHEVIIRKTANDDKRFSVYAISEEHYERLKGLLGLSV
jgi:hypothetical protein